jgi:tetratricopeptide (TPR) repeat protein
LRLGRDRAEGSGRRARPSRDAPYAKGPFCHPDDADTCNNRGNTLSALSRHEEALAAYDCALALRPDHADACNNRGNALLELGRHEEALAAYDRALALHPDQAKAPYNRIRSMFALSQWEEGFVALREALEHHPPARSGYAGDTREYVRLILTSGLEKNQWVQRARRLVDIFANGKALVYLGAGLVRSLADLSSNMLSAEALTAWREAWQEASARHDELRVPLRIFAVGIRYVQTQDPKALLDLVVEERAILASALGIDREAE